MVCVAFPYKEELYCQMGPVPEEWKVMAPELAKIEFQEAVSADWFRLRGT